METTRTGGRIVQHLESAKAELLDMVAEIDRMVGVLNQGEVPAARPAQLRVTRAPVTRTSRPGGAKGTVSMRVAALGILKDAGRPMGVKEILEEAEKRGAVTNSSDKVNSLDLLLYKAKSSKTDPAPIRKVDGAPRTWTWGSGSEGEE